jgi:ABC-type bacteriocin/lantibiotic exporter with double-glycine peptidase domain
VTSARVSPALVTVLGASAGLEVLAVVAPALQQVAIDHVLVAHRERWLVAVGLTLGVAILLRALLTFVRDRTQARIHGLLDVALTGAFVDHLLRLPIGFFEQRTPGDLIARAEGNGVLRDAVAQLTGAALDALLVVGYAALLLAYDPPLGVLLLAFALARAAAVAFTRPMREELATATAAASGAEQAIVYEALSALETVHAFDCAAFVGARYEDRAVRVANAVSRDRAQANTLASAFALLDEGARMLVLWLAGNRVIDGHMTLGVFSAFVALQGMLAAPLASVFQAASAMAVVTSNLRRIDDVLDTPAEATGAHGARALRGAVALRGVRFRYAANGPALLDGIDLDVPPGACVAVVGRSGAGKSTLARLLTGLAVPTEGTIVFDGRDLRALDLADLRGQIGFVPQEPFFFAGTVRDNLHFSAAGATQADMERACALACVDDVIDALPDGYDARIGEYGRSLSGGQLQRLALARALLRDPAVLILDEATSALDRPLEARVQASLRALRCTRIVIAHRLATVREADLIVVLDGGRIAQTGRYDELAARPGLFADLVHSMEDV